MPCLWRHCDNHKAIVSSFLPASVAIAGYYTVSQDPSVKSFVQKLRASNVVLRNQVVYAGVDAATIAPLGYASYLVYKEGGGFDYCDTTAALGIYGCNIAGLVALIAAYKKKNIKYIAAISAVNVVTAAVTSFAFSSITKRSGLLLLPYVAWSGYYAVVNYIAYKKSRNVPLNTQ